MKQSIKKSIRGLLLVPALALALGVGVAAPAFAADVEEPTGGFTLESGVQSGKGANQPENLFGGDDSVFTIITNILLFIIGAIAVIMLVIGGIRYTTSNGDSNQVTAAKNTIMYAIIGLIVAILAYAVVRFVVGGLAVA